MIKQLVGLPEGPASSGQPVSAEEDKKQSEKIQITGTPAGHSQELQERCKTTLLRAEVNKGMNVHVQC